MRKCLPIIVWSVLALAACTPFHSKPNPGPGPTPIPTPGPASSYTIAAIVTDQTHTPIAGARLTLEPGAVTYAQTNADGYAAALVPAGTYTLTADTDCCGIVRSDPFTVSGNRDVRLTATRPDPPKPWLTVTEAQLRAWRGSISTTVMQIPCGPRPGQPTNVMFTAEFGSSCWPSADKARAINAYGAKGWVHWAIGPVESRGYHDRYPEQQWIDNPDGFADLLEQLWRSGKIPVLFLLPDTGFCADGAHIDRDCVESRLTPFYSHPRIQALARITVLAWEPDYSSSDEVWGAQWMARVFPHARRGLHLPSGHSAPCLGSELAEAGGPIRNEGACWEKVAPYIHFYLQQETWTFGGEAAEGRSGKQQFLYNVWDTSHRFAEGSWPAAGADGKPIDVVAFEYASYYVTNDPARAKEADEWGDAAIAGAPFTDPVTGKTIDPARYLTGYGDGGTVDPLMRPRFTFSLTPSTSAPRFTFTFQR